MNASHLETPPFSETDERTALGCVLLDHDQGSDLLAKLCESDFHDLRHICIYHTLHAMDSEGAALDLVTLQTRLGRMGRMEEAGGPSYLAEVANAAPNAGIFDTVIKTLREFTHRRQTLMQIQRIQSIAIDPTASGDELSAAIATLPLNARTDPESKCHLRFWTPAELQGYEIPTDSILVGDKHIMRGGVVVIGGAPGIGKSRAGTALAVAGATGATWFGLTVHRKFRTLILQNENGLHRLRDEFEGLDSGALEDWVRVSEPPAYGMAFKDAEFRHQLVQAINSFRPDVIIFDPWNSLAADDTQRDYKAAFDVLRSVAGQGLTGAALVVVAHTRKPKVENRGTGRSLLHELAGAHLLGSVPRCVFIMQAGSNDGDDDRIVWQCAKNNDGDMGSRSAWHRRNGGFIPCEGFDWEAFDGAGPEARKGGITREDVRSLFICEDGANRRIARKRTVDQLMAATGKGKTACYSALDRFKDNIEEDDHGLLTWGD